MIVGVIGIASAAISVVIAFVDGANLPVLAVTTPLFWLIAFLCLRSAWVWTREICFRGASVTMNRSAVTISDPRRLDNPIELPLDEVLLAAVDEPSECLHHRRLPVFRSFSWHGVGIGDDAPPIGYLVAPDGVGLPALTAGEDDVNCALLFRNPQRLSAHRRVGFRGKREAVDMLTGGLILRTPELGNFAAAMARAGLLRRMTTEDLDVISPVKNLNSVQTPAIAAWPQADGSAQQQMQWPPQQAQQAADQSAGSRSQLETPDGGVGQVPDEVPDADAIGRRTRALVRGFYLRAAGAALLLAVAGVGLILGLHRFNGISIFFFILCGSVIAVIWPRSEPIIDDRPQLDLASNPAMRQLIEWVCRQSGAPLPKKVFLDLEFRATAQPHDCDADASAYAIGIGLPVLATTDVTQFASVLAHEVAHSRGDVARSRGLHTALMAIARTYERFRDHRIISEMVGRHADRFDLKFAGLCREAEYLADLHSSSVVGPTAVCSALRNLPVAEDATIIYWTQYAAPALEAGFAPPLAQGLAHFVHGSSYVRSRLAELDAELAEDMPQPLDNHPTIAQRINFVGRQSHGRDLPANRRSALSLLADHEGVQDVLLHHMAGARADALRRCDWPTALRHGLPAYWRMLADQHADALSGYSWWQLHELMADPSQFAASLSIPCEQSPQRHVQSDPLAPSFPPQFHLQWAIVAALATDLFSLGYSLSATVPGSAVRLVNGSHEIDPHETIKAIVAGELSREQWIAHCRRLGIAERPMVAVLSDSVTARGFAPQARQGYAANAAFA